MASQGTLSTSPEGRRAAPAARPPPEQGLRCPRCDSSNTKFCYYNNYSLTQPRHFCKTCRRYWTKGGSLRNVPVGGGCRKNKKTKALATTLAITGGTIRPNFLIPDHHNKSPQVDQLFPFSNLNSSSTNISTSAGHVYNQFLTFGDLSPSSMACDNNNIVASSCASSLESGGAIAQPSIMGFKPFDPISSPAVRQVGITNSGVYAGGRIQEIGSANMQTHDIASSIESLSSMNQDLHFKLQQQRFAMLLGGGSESETPANSASLIENQQIHQQPISFHASGSSKNGGCGVGVGDKVHVASDNTTELLLESSYPTASEIQSWSGMRQFS